MLAGGGVLRHEATRVARRWSGTIADPGVKGGMEPHGSFVPHETRSTDDWGIPGDAEVPKSKYDTRLWRMQNEEWRAGEEDDLWELLFPVDAGQLKKLVRVRPYWMNSYARWVKQTHEYASYVQCFPYFFELCHIHIRGGLDGHCCVANGVGFCHIFFAEKTACCAQCSLAKARGPNQPPRTTHSQPRYDDRTLLPRHPSLSDEDKDVVDMLRMTWKGMLLC